MSSIEPSARPCSRIATCSEVDPVQAGDMGETDGRGDVDPPADAVDPRRARVGDDDPGRAEDRQAAEDAEPGVPGGAGDLLTVVHRDLHLDVAGAAVLRASASTTPRIIARGTGLIAGSPTSSGSPGRVTVPTPGPARKTTPAPGAVPHRRPDDGQWVTSGSSPASLTTAAMAQPSPRSSAASANAGCCPRGRRDRRPGPGTRR